MNRYPLWKYTLIGVALLVALIFTLPNFFGEVPAVQVSPVRSTLKADDALLTRVQDILQKNKITADGVFLDHQSVKARFEDSETQLRAKDALQSALGDDYVVALNLLSRNPQWLSSIGALPMYLGLDLRGGVHFLLQVDMKGALAKKVEAYTNDIRSALREKRIQYSGIAREGQSVIVRFRDAAMRDKALNEIEKSMPDLDLRTQDDPPEFRIVGTLKPEAQRRTQDFALQQNITTLRNRVNELGVAEPIIQQQGSDRVVVQLPGVQDTAKAKDILGRTATLEVRLVDEEKMNDPVSLQAAVGGQAPFGTELYIERGGSPVLVKKQVVLTGDRINDAQPGFDSQTGEPAVHISLDGTGARIFQQVTRENVGKRMAILLFEKGKGEVVTAPVIRQEIGGGRVQISGRMTTREASDVALLLRAGALAAPMDIIEERTVGPSLGADNIRRGFHSMWIGFSAIALFMIVYYRLFGVISVAALAINLLLLISLLSMLQATLTLPGIAAIALTLGMAIDANVLINERIREELRNGNTPQAAIAAGYERAWNTILDSNVTTLIAGLALFAFGSGPIKGFAVVHCLGILTSMFSAVMVSRGLVNLIYGSRRRLEKVSIGQVWRPAAVKS
ncbi:MAG: protein-export rane protein SecD [Betaproteobacteria bacterium]|jgi:preprotein translocase subunit SecD|nr:protein-export rane protein SecD [Betaproteobacteria bacterium]MEA3158038.1 preprotein translocase subunit SecD [Betaproteobacteria bacterium]